jgi:hypothetical protein
LIIVLDGSVEVSGNNGREFNRKKGESWVSFDTAQSKLLAKEDAVIYCGGAGIDG